MSFASALNAGRRAALARMASRATVKRPDPANPTTDANGFEVPGWAPVYTDLPLRLAGADQGGSGTRSASVGGVDVQLAVRVAHFPHDTANLIDGDVVEVTAGENAGTFVRIVEAAGQDQATARRVPVVEAQQPEGWS